MRAITFCFGIATGVALANAFWVPVAEDRGALLALTVVFGVVGLWAVVKDWD